MLPACILHHPAGPTHGVMAWGAIGNTSRSLVCTYGTLNSDRYISVVLKPVFLSFIRALRNVRFTRIMHDRTKSVLFGSSLIQEMFGCYCPGLHVLQISHNSKRLVRVTRLKLHGQLYLCILFYLCKTQFSSFYSCYCCQRWSF